MISARKFVTLWVLLSSVLLLAACDPDSQQIPQTSAALAGQPELTGAQSCLTDTPVVTGAKPAFNHHQEVWIEGGSFTMGSNNRYREESPAFEAEVAGFWIDIHEVTNRQFAAFVEQTGYVTSAERSPLAENYPDVPEDKLVPGSALFVPPVNAQAADLKGHWTQWWQFVEGADWRHPEGPESNIVALDDYPVVHISYLDAKAYANWAGRDLPTESQWELAAQGAPGTYGTTGAEQLPAANTWQGFFPLQDKATDGFSGAAPVGCFAPGASGLYDMIGNVWEWVSDEYQVGHAPPDSATAMRPDSATGSPVPVRVIKGGSHLCADNYCRRNAPQSRQPQEEDFGVNHLGFRTVRNAKEK